jgi:hypothetical protein
MSAEQQLAVVPPQENAMAVFSAEKGLEPWLQKIRLEIDGFTPDISSRKGRDAIASMAYKVARSKTALDDVGKKLVADLKEIPKKIDAERKRVRDTLDAWQEEVRRPLNEWQAKEDARVDAHNSVIGEIKLFGEIIEGLSAEDLEQCIQKVEAIVIGEHLEEFEAEAARAKDQVLAKLRPALATRKSLDAELAEIAKFNAEKAIREQQERDAEIARAAVAEAQRVAAAAAQAERDAAARREQSLKDQAEQAMRDAAQKARDAEAEVERQRLQLQLQAEQSARAAEQAETNRIAAEQRAEQQRVDAEQRQAAAVEQARLDEIARQKAAADEIYRQNVAREADKAHKGAIYKAAKEAFIKHGLNEECARLAVKLVASNLIPAFSIKY